MKLYVSQQNHQTKQSNLHDSYLGLFLPYRIPSSCIIPSNHSGVKYDKVQRTTSRLRRLHDFHDFDFTTCDLEGHDLRGPD